MLSLLRHGFTSLRRSPTVAFTIIVTLGLALAAAVVVFTFLNSFLLRPLPYGDASRLAVVYEHSIKGGRDNFSRVTYGNVAAIEERATSFSRTGIFRNESMTVYGRETTEVAFVQRVTPHIFPMMNARAALGAIISRDNAEIGGLRALLLSDALWRRRFGADASMIGRVVRLDNTSYQVVGIMPEDFVIPTGDNDPQAWVALLPADYDRNERTQRRHHFWGELAPGRTVAAAESELAAIAAKLRDEFPKENTDRTLKLMPMRDDLLGGFGQQLVLLQGAVLLVLAVACFNCLCLLIARAIQRRREFAVRLALGAARRHLLAQLLAESLWLSVPAAVLALGIAAFTLPLGVSLVPTAAAPTLRALAAPQLDLNVIRCVALSAIGIAMAFSAVPLLQTRRLNLESTLREGGRSANSPTGTKAARWLASAQIAVALALLISGALLLRSQRNLTQLNPGFPIAELDQFRVGTRGPTYANDPAKRLQFFERVADNLRTLPGVRDVAVASFIFIQPPIGYQGFIQEGDGLQMSESPKRALQCSVLPNFFSALDLRLLDGRLLNEADVTGRPHVAVINQSLAAKYWPGVSPIGKRVRLEGPRNAEWVEIVGVVSDILGAGNQPRVIDVIHLTISQWQPVGLGMSFSVRHSGVPPDERSLHRAVAQIDPSMQFFGHVSPAEIYARGAWQTTLVTKLVVAFALLAVALALAGIYAVNSFFVARRVNEFGIRAALGASEGNLLRLVLRDSLRLTLAGLATGVVLAFAASRGLVALLYAVPAVDLTVYIGAALLMTIACVVASLIPARRAAKVDPIAALRDF